MSTLTEREKQVCEIVEAAPGLPVKLIARELKVSRAAAKKHLENAYSKFGVNNRYELIAVLCRGASQS